MTIKTLYYPTDAQMGPFWSEICWSNFKYL